MNTFATIALLTAAYVLVTLVPRRRQRWRPAALSLIPAALGAWSFGDDGGLGILLAVVLVGSVCLAGLIAFDRVGRGGLWIVAQLAVVVALAVLTVWLGPVTRALPLEMVAVLLVAGGVIVTVDWGGVFVGHAIRPWAESMHEAHGDDGVIRPRGLPKGFEDGGRTIGRLERLLIFLFVLAGSPAAIGFLVTAKSILRFGEIKDRETRKEAEYIIIGTLMSFSFALMASYLIRLALLAVAPETAQVLLLL